MRLWGFLPAISNNEIAVSENTLNIGVTLSDDYERHVIVLSRRMLPLSGASDE